jgi:hypothetical protein
MTTDTESRTQLTTLTDASSRASAAAEAERNAAAEQARIEALEAARAKAPSRKAIAKEAAEAADALHAAQADYIDEAFAEYERLLHHQTDAEGKAEAAAQAMKACRDSRARLHRIHNALITPAREAQAAAVEHLRAVKGTDQENAAREAKHAADEARQELERVLPAPPPTFAKMAATGHGRAVWHKRIQSIRQLDTVVAGGGPVDLPARVEVPKDPERDDRNKAGLAALGVAS